jgi:hypothetical protein
MLHLSDSFKKVNFQVMYYYFMRFIILKNTLIIEERKRCKCSIFHLLICVNIILDKFRNSI